MFENSIKWNESYILSFYCTRETKLLTFQFKLLHKRIATCCSEIQLKMELFQINCVFNLPFFFGWSLDRYLIFEFCFLTPLLFQEFCVRSAGSLFFSLSVTCPSSFSFIFSSLLLIDTLTNRK